MSLIGDALLSGIAGAAKAQHNKLVQDARQQREQSLIELRGDIVRRNLELQHGLAQSRMKEQWEQNEKVARRNLEQQLGVAVFENQLKNLNPTETERKYNFLAKTFGKDATREMMFPGKDSKKEITLEKLVAAEKNIADGFQEYLKEASFNLKEGERPLTREEFALQRFPVQARMLGISGQQGGSLTPEAIEKAVTDITRSENPEQMLTQLKGRVSEEDIERIRAGVAQVKAAQKEWELEKKKRIKHAIEYTNSRFGNPRAVMGR